MEQHHKIKEFKPTSWAIDNKTSIFVLAFFIAVFGIMNYISIPKEQFPELVIPTFTVNTYYPGTSPVDMENLVTKEIEKNLKSKNGVRKITSNSFQDFSSIVIEFQTGVEVEEAKQLVKDAVDLSKRNLPNDLPSDPTVTEINFSELPIMYINISGNYDLVKLKKYADQLKDKIEAFPEITRVDLVGALDREIQINVDMYRMQASSVTFSSIEQAVRSENMTISGGSITMGGMTRSIRIAGEFQSVENIRNIVLTSSSGALVKLSDIAVVNDSYKEQESFAHLDNKPVVTLNVIKKSGENLLGASDKIKEAIHTVQKNDFPDDLKVLITGDMSRYTRSTLTDLNNTIIIGFILVTVVLMFFMGLTNAIFVGLSIPLAMALAYIVMPFIGFTMNMLVMFSFIFALGIVVDDAIVVIENTHRIFKKSGMNIEKSAKFAAGEVFIPILSGTLTTLAPFFPLAFWPGVVGKFMKFIPVTIIIALFASLIVAYIFNTVFAVSFMKHNDDDINAKSRNTYKTSMIIALLAALFYVLAITKVVSGFGIANFILFIAIYFVFHNTWGYKWILKFQKVFIPKTLDHYERMLRWMLEKRRPYYLLLTLVLLLPLSILITGLSKPKVVFFPDNQPNNIYAYIKLPVGTDVKTTDSIAQQVEKTIEKILEPNKNIVESVVTNVALGVSESTFDSGTKTANKAKISVNFVEFSKRGNVNTQEILDKIREELKNIPGVKITIGKNKMGPPTGKPINILITGEDMNTLVSTAFQFKDRVDSLGIPGIEELKTDFETQKPELIIEIDRERANREGITTGQIGNEIRTAITGREISKFREGEDQFPIQLRYNEYVRKHIDRIMDLKITYRDMNSGLLRQIPMSAVAHTHYKNTFGGIYREDVQRAITIYSNVLSGYTSAEINTQLTQVIESFKTPDGVTISLTGEKQDMKDAMGFLNNALLISLALILFILITQFNSLGKAMIILIEVLFSIIGVLLGFTLFDMTFSVIMTGMGIVALAGIVVRNGILLVEFSDVLLERGNSLKEAVIQAGKTRITPVMLTATATILGLIPLAIGLNLNFFTLFSELNPHIHFGGDNVTFFSTLAWTIVFGLAFATFLTLVYIPVMYYILYHGKDAIKRRVRKVFKKEKTVDLDKLF